MRLQHEKVLIDHAHFQHPDCINQDCTFARCVPMMDVCRRTQSQKPKVQWRLLGPLPCSCWLRGPRPHGACQRSPEFSKALDVLKICLSKHPKHPEEWW